MSHGCSTMGSFVMVCPVCPHSPRWRKDRHHTNVYEVPGALQVGIIPALPAKKEVSECLGHRLVSEMAVTPCPILAFLVLLLPKIFLNPNSFNIALTQS